MSIAKKSDRQELISAIVDINFDDFDTTIVGTSGTSTMEAIDLPEKAIVIGGNLTIVTAWDTKGKKATRVLTTSANPIANETVTINGHVYTFKASVTTTADEVKIGASEAATLQNLVYAINGTGTPGTNYGSATVVNADVTAETDGVHTVTITSIAGGTAANSYATTETLTNGSWAGATMTGGAAPADTLAVKIGSTTYKSAASADSTANFALVPTADKLSTADTVDVVWDLANDASVAPTAGLARLRVDYIVDGRASFSEG